MRLAFFALAAPLVGALSGCGAAMVGAPVHYIATRTAGVMFVVVHPDTPATKHYVELKQPGDDAKVHPDSEYLLICDGRKAEGMHCDMATEATLSRFSATPAPTGSVPVIDEGVGTVPDINIQHRTTPAEASSAGPSTSAPAGSGSAAALPPPPAPPPPPTPAAPAAAAGGRK
jgi:hypothetical protein